MNINVLLFNFGLTGGNRAVLEIADRLSELHDVRIIAPLVPLDYTFRSLNDRSLFSLAVATALRLPDRGPEWINLSAETMRVPHFDYRYPRTLNRFIPDADVTIATEWRTGYAATALDETKGEKIMFVQHYEIWPVWRCKDCWDRAMEVANDRDLTPSVAMAHVTPGDDHHRRFKQSVDEILGDDRLALVYTSDWERRVLAELGVEPRGQVLYGVDTDQFHPTEDSATPTVLALYRDAEEKGDAEALTAFERLSERRPEVELEMFGRQRPPDLPSYIMFHEDPPQDELRDIYTAADVLVYPSWVEGYGMPPMEAMACETVLVSTDVGAVRDYTPSGAVSFTPIRDPMAIVEAVEDWLNDPDHMAAMQAAARRHIETLTWETAAKDFAAHLSVDDGEFVGVVE